MPIAGRLLYNALGFGYLESVYQKALYIEMISQQLPAVAQLPIDVGLLINFGSDGVETKRKTRVLGTDQHDERK